MRPSAQHRMRIAVALAAALVGATAALTACVGTSSVPALPIVTSAPAVATTWPSVARVATASPVATPSAPATIAFAVIGDYGTADSHEAAVASMVASWKPGFVVTTGDDYYAKAGASGTAKYERSTGRYYSLWSASTETTTAAFFPAIGNHDYREAGIRTYLRYFDLPGPGYASSSDTERYYDFVAGPVHFFVLDSCAQEPDGATASSRQARWLQSALASSTAAWNVVVDHHPPYSSDAHHHSTVAMRWPFKRWGADVVLSGHAHNYERVMRSGFPYIVNGLGGATRHGFATPLRGSVVRYMRNWGAQRCTASESTLTLTFYSVGGRRVDELTLTRD